MLSVVAVLEDIPESGLLRGQVGTVVERLAPGVYEVEFVRILGTPLQPVDASSPRAQPSRRLNPARPPC
jgi:hypothetical protein